MIFSESLKKNRDFRTVYRKGKSYANKYLVMYIMENHQNRNRLGISVSKKNIKTKVIKKKKERGSGGVSCKGPRKYHGTSGVSPN